MGFILVLSAFPKFVEVIREYRLFCIKRYSLFNPQYTRNRYCGRPFIDADSTDTRGEVVKEDVFDETAVVSTAIDQTTKMMQAESRRQRPRSTQPLESSEDPMRREDLILRQNRLHCRVFHF